VRETRGGYHTAELIRELEAEMLVAAENLQFEKAAILRDQVKALQEGKQIENKEPAAAGNGKRQVKYDRKLHTNVVKKKHRATSRQ
jgi:excinuclease ABC subunit B